MPTVQKATGTKKTWNTFIYAEMGEMLHPLLVAVQTGNVAAFKALSEALAPVMVYLDTETEIHDLAFAGQLFMNGTDSVYGHGVCQNIAWKAAALGHSELLAYMLDNKVSLGLDDGDFIAAVGEANRRGASAALKEVVEAHPEVIVAYNKEMRPKQYQPGSSEPPLATTSELLLNI